MFSKTLLTAVSYAKQLEAQRIRLAIPGQSPLGVLMSYSAADNPKASDTVECFIDRVSDVTVMRGGSSEHDSVIATLVDELAPLVQSHIRVAREIGQLASELSENVRRYAESVPSTDASGEFNIIKDETPSIFEEPSIIALMDKASSAPIRDINYNFCSGPRDFDTLFGYLITGNTKLDEQVKEMIAGFESGWLEDIWYGFFATNLGISSKYRIALNSLPAGERLSVGYVCYCFTNKLLSDIPKDAVGSLSQFESGLADFREQLLIDMRGGLSDYQSQLTNKIIVIGYRSHLRTVIVNGPVYRDWLESGGSPELVLGSLLSANPVYTAAEFGEKSSDFLRQWNSFCALHNSESDLRRSVFLRSIYLTCFTEALGKIAPFEESFRKAQPAFAEQAISKVETYLTGTGINDLIKTLDVSLELMAGIRFDYTPAKMILKDIDGVIKSTPDVNIREAALVAASNYLSHYLAGQIGIMSV